MKIVHRSDALHTPNSRAAALRRLERANRWLVAASVLVTGVLTDVAANAFPGHDKEQRGPAAHRGRATHKPLKPPTRAPTTSTRQTPAPTTEAPAEAPAEAAPETGAPQTSASEQSSEAPAPEQSSEAPAPETHSEAPTPEERREPAPAPETSEPSEPIVSGGS